MKLVLALIFTTLAIQAAAPTQTIDDLEAAQFDACMDQFEAVSCE